MRTTIGELTAEILPYAAIIEMGSVGDTPFLKAYLGGEAFVTAYLSVIQVAEHKYSVCDTDEELHGERYLLTKGNIKPFIKERDFIRQWLGKNREDDDNETIGLNLSPAGFSEYFFNVLLKYGILKMTPTLMESPLRALSFSNGKLPRRLETLCKIKGRESGRIKDFVTMVQTANEPINLSNYNEKEIGEIYNRFKRHGILLDIQENKIMNLTFMRGR